MKKIAIWVFVALLTITLVGCTINIGGEGKSKKKDRSLEGLIDLYTRAYNEEKPELMKEVFPEFFISEDELTVENIRRAKSRYGNNVKVSVKVTGKTKMDDEWIEQANKDLESFFKTDMRVKECYEIHGTSTIKGSEAEDSSEIEEMWYCDFGSDWYLIAG